MTYYNNTHFQRCILQCIITTLLTMILVGFIIMGIEPSISIYILISSISSFMLIMFISMLRGCYITYQNEILRRRLYPINPLLPPIPPIVILQGNSIMLGIPIQQQSIEHMIVPIYVATINFNK
jgi:hypothetical protein